MMLIIIWDTYFNEQLSQKSLLYMLQNFFAIICLSIFTTFIVCRVITKNIDNLLTVLGSFG